MYIGVCVLSRRDILPTFKGRYSENVPNRSPYAGFTHTTFRYDIFYYKYNNSYVEISWNIWYGIALSYYFYWLDFFIYKL